jgi:hypothetical protein
MITRNVTFVTLVSENIYIVIIIIKNDNNNKYLFCFYDFQKKLNGTELHL